MNKVSRLFALLLISLILTLSVNAAESEILDYTVTTYFPSATTVFHTQRIADNNTNTYTALLSGCAIDLSCEEDIGYVYIKFAGKPVPYTLTFHNTATGEATTVEKDGNFMHDLTEIPTDKREKTSNTGYESEVTNITYVTISSDFDMPLADITLYSLGELPPDVQRWEKTFENCDILCFPTHADDDTLYMGGIISKYANEEKLVQVAFICDFEKDVQRRHELLNGLWAMGVKAYPILGIFPDLGSRSLRYAKTQYNSAEMLGFITECIRRTKPSVVVAHDLDGEYGHGAHMLSSSLVCEAIEITGNKEFYPESAEEYGVHTVQKTFLHLYEENRITVDVFTPVTDSGLTPFELSENGYGCHFSQHKWGFEVTVDDPDADLSSFGLFHSTVGYDTSSGDILEGVSPIIPKISKTSEAEKTPLTSATPASSYIPSTSDDNTSSVDTSTQNAKKTSITVCVILASLLILLGIVTRRKH